MDELKTLISLVEDLKMDDPLQEGRTNELIKSIVNLSGIRTEKILAYTLEILNRQHKNQTKIVELQIDLYQNEVDNLKNGVFVDTFTSYCRKCRKTLNSNQFELNLNQFNINQYQTCSTCLVYTHELEKEIISLKNKVKNLSYLDILNLDNVYKLINDQNKMILRLTNKYDSDDDSDNDSDDDSDNDSDPDSDPDNEFVKI